MMILTMSVATVKNSSNRHVDISNARPVVAIFGNADVNNTVSTITVATGQNISMATMIYPYVTIVLFCSSADRQYSGKCIDRNMNLHNGALRLAPHRAWASTAKLTLQFSVER
jgi:hypothetical protein